MLASCGWLCFFLSAGRAQAHTSVEGLGEFAGGLLHPFTTPAHLLVLVALGLWLGQHPPLRLKTPVAFFAGIAASGLVLTVVGHIRGVYPPLLIGVSLLVGACVALGRPLPIWLKLFTCALAALLLGLDSGVDAGTGGVGAAKILSATWVSLVLCVINLAFYVSLLPAVRWVQTGVQVIGSWIVAIAFLLLAFALRR